MCSAGNAPRSPLSLLLCPIQLAAISGFSPIGSQAVFSLPVLMLPRSMPSLNAPTVLLHFPRCASDQHLSPSSSRPSWRDSPAPSDPLDRSLSLSPQTAPMISLSLAAIFKVAFFLLAIVAVVDLLTMSQNRRIRQLSRRGLSQRAIASRLNITRYRVRVALS